MDFYILEIPIPALDTFFWLAGLGLLILTTGWLVNNWPYRVLLNRLPKFSDRFGANAIAYLAVLFIPVWIALVLLTLLSIYRLGFFPAPAEKSNLLANRVHYLALVGMMGALAALLGTPLALYRVFTTERQTKAAEEGLTTDRINKAVEGLGAVRSVARVGRNIEYCTNEPVPNSPHEIFEWQDDPVDITTLNAIQQPVFGAWSEYQRTEPNLEVRVGAIYALERIAKYETSEHLQIMEILCSYIRNNSATRHLMPSDPPFERASARIDIQTVVTVIGRRSFRQKRIERESRFRLDIRGCDLSGCDFSYGDFSAALFNGSRLEACFFEKANLTATRFGRCLLNFSDFFECNLRGTRFDRAIFNNGDGFRGPVPRKEEDCIFINGADFSVVFLNSNLGKVFGTSDSRIRSMNIDFANLDTHTTTLSVGTPGVPQDELREAENWLSQVPYRLWSPYTSDDGANGELELHFREAHNLDGWPHTKE